MTEPVFELQIDKPAKGERNAASMLYRQLREAMRDGRLPAGTQLPPSRRSRGIFGVSRNTVVAIYERLWHEGHVVMRRGSGTYVSERLPRPPASRAASRVKAPYPLLNDFWLQPEIKKWLGFWRISGDEVAGTPRGGVDLRPALVDSRLFPHEALRRAIGRQLLRQARLPGRARSPEGDQGSERLREAITRHIAVTRAIAAPSEDIIVTAGAQQAFDLLARVLVGARGAVVAVEDPGYPPMRVAFAAAGARLVFAAVDAEGLVVESLPADTNVICLCPSHQFPLGAALSTERRRALLRFARRHAAVIVEDDYDGEFRNDDGPLAALKAQDPEIVFHVGTFSKSMLPGLRVGFVVAPHWAKAALIAAKNCSDWHVSAPLQSGIASFIEAGHLTRHVRKMRHIYGRRRAHLLTRLRNEFNGVLTPMPSSYGMHVTTSLGPGLNADEVADVLARQHIKIHSLTRYAFERPAPSGLVFGFGATDEAGLDRALSLLRKTISR